jgi:hypothetical protein
MNRLAAALVLLSSALCPLAARAQATADATANYALFVLGLRMADGQVHLVYNPASYRMDVQMHTTGAAAIFVSGQQESEVDGVWHAAGPLPHVLSSSGTWNGDLHKLVISFESGGPVVTTLLPPDRKKREPIPPDLLRESVDVSSAIAALIRQVSTTGSCERTARTFDGRRLAEVRAHDAGEERLLPTDRSSFSGNTKRCTFEVRQLSGFEHGDDREDAAKTRHATAWLARLTPGGPLLPVRLDMEARLVGSAQMVLVSKDPK